MLSNVKMYVHSHSNIADFGTGLPFEAVGYIEDKLNCTLPKSYKDFLLEFGWLTFRGNDYFGEINSKPGLPNGVTMFNLQERNEGRLPDYLIAFKDEEDFGLICMDISNRDVDKPAECRIIRWDPWDLEGDDLGFDSFASFLEHDIRELIEQNNL